jgi:transcriptional regulator with XRE-family HTH domain
MAGFGPRVKKAREHAGLSQPELATRIGIKQQSIQYLESPNKKATGSRHTAAIARETGVDVTWLSTGRGEMLPAQGVRQEGAGYETLSPEAREVAIAWSKLSAPMRDTFRELLYIHAVIDTQYPWLRRGRPRSNLYKDWERGIEQNMQALIQLRADKKAKVRP